MARTTSAPRRAPGADPAPVESSIRFSAVNLGLLAAGLVVIAAGFTLLAGGSTVAAPLLLVAGYTVLVPLGLIL